LQVAWQLPAVQFTQRHTPSRFQLDVPQRTRAVHHTCQARGGRRALSRTPLGVSPPAGPASASGFRIGTWLGPPSANGGVNRQLSSSGPADSVCAEPGTSTGGDHSGSYVGLMPHVATRSMHVIRMVCMHACISVCSQRSRPIRHTYTCMQYMYISMYVSKQVSCCCC